MFQAKVGWEIADGEFIWDMGKKFNSKFEARRWVSELVKTGNFDAGKVTPVQLLIRDVIPILLKDYGKFKRSSRDLPIY